MPLPVAVPVYPRFTVTFWYERFDKVAVTVATPPFSANGLPDRPRVTEG